jgi:AcrR family transcriptional regulator
MSGDMGEPMARVGAAWGVVAERTENIAVGLRERKKARLRQQIIDTSIKLFRKRGFENTRIDDIVQVLEISQPTFFRYFSSKDAVLREVGERGFACIRDRLRSELSNDASTAKRLRRQRSGGGPQLVAGRCAFGRDGSGALR